MIEADVLQQRLEASREVYLTNDHGTHTVPSEKIFPHMWKWDSAFFAIGMAHEDPERAALEIETYFEAQWGNGMGPNQIISPGLRFIFERFNLHSRANPNSPEDKHTSGISQPPMMAEAVWQVGQALEESDRKLFYKKMLPKLIDLHLWHFNERESITDGQRTGRVFVIHPYETGMDNSPPLLMPVREQFGINMAAKPSFKEKIVHGVMNILRRDLRNVPADERMYNRDVLAYQALTKQIRKHKYDAETIWQDPSIPLTEDLAYNAIFMQANIKLQKISRELEVELPEDLQAGIARQQNGFEAFWNEDLQAYVSRNARTGKQIPIVTVSSLLPLYAFAHSDEVLPHESEVISALKNPHKFWTKFPFPSVPIDDFKHFDRYRYWSAPAWLWINKLIEYGLREHGHTEAANEVLEVMISAEPNEYFDTFTGEPLGIGYFTGTAMVVMDAVYRYIQYQKEAEKAA